MELKCAVFLLFFWQIFLCVVSSLNESERAKLPKKKAHRLPQRRWSCCRLLAGGSLKRQNVIFVFLAVNGAECTSSPWWEITFPDKHLGEEGKKPQQPAAWSRRGGNYQLPLMKASQRGKVFISPPITHWQSHPEEDPPEIYIKTSQRLFSSFRVGVFFLLFDWPPLIFLSLSVPIFTFLQATNAVWWWGITSSSATRG